MEKKQRARYFPVSSTDWMKAKYGALDKDNPEIIFIRARTRVKSDHTKPSYTKEVRTIINAFEKIVAKTVPMFDGVFAQYYIANLELSDIGLAANKTSVLKYDIFLKPKEKMELSEYANHINPLTASVNSVIKSTLDSCHIMLVNK